MRVLFLGAGASKPASYPLAGEVMDTVEKALQDIPGSPTAQWEKWEEFRKRLPRKFRAVAYSQNPEVILSFFDLLHLACQLEDGRQRKMAIERTNLCSGIVDDGFRKWFRSSARAEFFGGARVALASFKDCLGWYFSFRHMEDESNRARRDYLRKRFAHLGNGDVVITLNWDTTAERTLAEEGRWNPSSGYGGIDKNLKLTGRGFPGNTFHSVPKDASIAPQIRVLKLHGSTGWYETRGALYFDERFLLHLPLDPLSMEKGLRWYDADRSSPFGNPPGELLLAYPSFLKQLSNPIINAIWREAGSVLGAADTVDIWGYSLPESDNAVRALLLALVERTKLDQVEVCVHDPDKGTLERWDGFFEGSARLLPEPVEGNC